MCAMCAQIFYESVNRLTPVMQGGNHPENVTTPHGYRLTPVMQGRNYDAIKGLRLFFGLTPVMQGRN